MTTSSPKTTIDWFRARVQAEPSEALQALKPMFGTHTPNLRFGALQKGMLGFKHALLMQIDDMPIGRMDFGGESQRGWVRIDMGGKGCEWVQDWAAAEGVEALERAEIRRLDIALTTWDGEMTHEQVVQAHTDGRFVTRGRPPSMRTIVSTDPRAGRTCYVGKRERSDKFFRAYEKGYEIVAKMGDGLGGAGFTKIDGKNVEDIYRCELELKAESGEIPWEVIERRDQYFAGAYPFCADVLPGVEADILLRRPERAPQLDLAAVLAHVKVQYGAALFTALVAHKGDMTAIWDRIVGDHHSESLLAAGVLLVDHD